MDQNIPQIRWSTEGFATGGAEGAKKCKKVAKLAGKWEISRNDQKVLKWAKSEQVAIWTSFTSKIARNYYCFVKVEISCEDFVENEN